MNWTVIDTETNDEIESYMTEHEALVGLENAERRYRSRGLHRFVVRDAVKGNTYHRAECACGREHGAS